jgi:hypothetical protein
MRAGNITPYMRTDMRTGVGVKRTNLGYDAETVPMYDAADSDPASLSGDGSDAAHQTTSTAYATSWREA